MGEELRGPKASAVMLASKIVLNPLRRQNLPDGTNMRTFEVPGCGAFVLSTRTQGAVDIFSESIAGAYFDSPRECCEKIERYLLDVNGRRDIAHRAHQLVEVEHQYRNRALQILDVHREICGS
jgi:spore maturation protein CgeB